MNSKQFSSGVRRIVFILFCATGLLIVVHSKTINSSPYEQYERVLNGCQDRIAAWRNLSTASEMSPVPSDNNNNPQAVWYPSGIFIRGRWKQSLAHSARPSFFSGNEGKFDFFSSRWAGSPAANQEVIQNISATLFLRDSKESPNPESILQAVGVYDSKSGEVCLVGCIQNGIPSGSVVTYGAPTNNTGNNTAPGGLYKPLYDENGQDCTIRCLLTILRSPESGRISAAGTLESLRNGSDPQYFTGISLTGSMVNDLDQKALYHVDVLVSSLLYALEAGILIWQIIHSIRSPSGYFVSMLMILVQIVTICFLAAHLIYVPLRLLTYRRFKYLITSLALVPWLILAFLIALNFFFFSVIFRKRRIAKRMNVEERPQELRLASVCIIIYGITGAVLWSLKNFETYCQVVWCWFLLPQVIANVFWDLRTKPLHWIYLIGVSICRILFIGFNAIRPTIYGYDDLNDFPQSWFWGITFTVLFFLTYALLQQRYGGRSFLPQRWFGYHELSSSNAQVKRDQMFDTADDGMLEL